MNWREFDFVGNRKKSFTLSLVIFAIIFVFGIFFGIEMDVAFTGGTIITYNYDGEIDFNDLEKAIEDIINQEISIEQKAGIAGGANSFDIVLASKVGIPVEVQAELSQYLDDTYGTQLDLLSNSSVDPVMGKEFFAKGLVAVALASFILVIYITQRFSKIDGLSAGITAVIALVHDVIMVVGTFIIFRIPLDDNFIAVVLTILGYSINDTIVIYDRLRENMTTYGKKLSTKELVNRSIKETMTRTIGTSGAVLGTLAIVCIVALTSNVPSIISFAFPMFMGAISGTYSTIFIAGPLWVMWQEKKSATT